MNFLFGLGMKYLWYLVGFGLIVALASGLYFYVKAKGAAEYREKVIKQTEEIVKERVESDEKINRLPPDRVRDDLRKWMLDHPR